MNKLLIGMMSLIVLTSVYTTAQAASLMSVPSCSAEAKMQDRLAIVSAFTKQIDALAKEDPAAIKVEPAYSIVSAFAPHYLPGDSNAALDIPCSVAFNDAESALVTGKKSEVVKAGEAWRVCLSATAAEETYQLAKPLFSCFQFPSASDKKP